MPSPPGHRQRSVVLVAFDGMQLLGVVGPMEVLDASSQLIGRDRGYAVRIATPGGRPVRVASGLRIDADVALAHVRPRDVDTLIVGGSMDVSGMVADAPTAASLARIAGGARRTCSVCTGAFLLGAAGLLDGRRATTHWAFGGELARRHPTATVQPDRIFVRDGTLTTSAGATAGMDLALALVEEDHGPDVARSVARWTVMFLQRPGGQSQFSERLAVRQATDATLRAVLDRVVTDPAGDHCLATMAQTAAMSERHFRRRFLQQTGTTPARFVERVRVEAARDLLERSAMPVEGVASACGFGAAETLRRAFLRVLGVGPADYRARFRTSTREPLAA